MPEIVACNLCGGSSTTDRPDLTTFLELPEPLKVQQCDTCDLHYMSPRPTPAELLDLYLKEPYFGEANATRGANRLAFYDARMARLEEHRPGRGRLLGVGCLEGGYALEVARRRGWDVTGIESSEILADHARKNLSIKVETVHGWNLSGLPEGQFDAAYTHSFEHFSDPRGMLRQIRRALRPGGTLMIEVPYQFYSLKDVVRIRLAHALGKHRYRVFRKAPPFTFHLYFYDPRTLGRLLAEEGFDLVALRTYLPSHPVFARNPRGRWVQEGLYALGGLFKRGPSLETISRAAANDSAYGLSGQDGCTGPSRTVKSQRLTISR